MNKIGKIRNLTLRTVAIALQIMSLPFLAVFILGCLIDGLKTEDVEEPMKDADIQYPPITPKIQ